MLTNGDVVCVVVGGERPGRLVPAVVHVVTYRNVRVAR